MWLFTNLVDRAFGGWIWPLLGFLFAPWTTLIYVIVWSPGGASGIDWLWIALGALADAATYSARAARRRSSAYA